MTLKLLDTGVTRQLVDKLAKLSDVVKQLSSENFQRVSPALIELDKKLESINYRYAGMSMVNSVDSYKVDGMIRHLKMSSKEFLFCQCPEFITSMDGEDGFKDFIVPAGFTGFNSIVFDFGIMNFNPYLKKDNTVEFSKWYVKNDRTIRFDWKNIVNYSNATLEYPLYNPDNNHVSILFWR